MMLWFPIFMLHLIHLFKIKNNLYYSIFPSTPAHLRSPSMSPVLGASGEGVNEHCGLEEAPGPERTDWNPIVRISSQLMMS